MSGGKRIRRLRVSC